MIQKISKKFVITIVIGIILIVATWFIARATMPQNDVLVTSKYGEVTQKDYYKQIKSTPDSENQLRQIMLDKILAAKYGKKVTKAMVEGSYKASEAMYSPADWAKALKQSDYTPTTYKAQIRKNLIVRTAIKANANLGTTALTAEFKNYHPSVAVKDIMVGKKADAVKVIALLKAGKSFDSVMQKYSLDTATNSDKGMMPRFNSTSTSVDPAIKAVAFNLKNNQVSPQPIKGTQGYYVIKMVDNPGKGSVEKYRDVLTEQIISDYLANKNGRSVKAIYQKLYKASDVVVRDKSLKAVGTFAK